MVSVLLLSWNHENYIEKAINSIIRQTYRDIEVIYLDNNSADNTFTIATTLLGSSGLKYSAYRREKNFGIAANYNFLYHKSTGAYLCLLSGDDWLHKDNINEKVRPLDNDPQVAMVHSGGYKYYQEIDVYQPLPVVTFPEESALSELLKRNYISSTGILLRTSAVEAVGGWNESLIAEDGELWVRILSHYKIAAIDKLLYFYRQHLKSVSSDAEYMYKAHMEIYEASKDINKSKKLALRHIKDHYLAVKVKQTTSVSLFLKILRHFRFEKIYFVLLLKSILPISWKNWYFRRSFKKKYGNVRVEEESI